MQEFSEKDESAVNPDPNPQRKIPAYKQTWARHALQIELTQKQILFAQTEAQQQNKNRQTVYIRTTTTTNVAGIM